jgi:LmbE family N-acetylglucosaminyl deacetylase
MPDGPSRIEDMKTCELVGRLDAIVREYEPAAVFTHSSSDFHNDHLLIYNACLPTQRLAYFDLFSYHPTNCRPVPTQFHAKAYVDITDTIDAKMHSIAAHASQFGGRGLDTEMYREFARMQGRMIGVQYAEGLDVVRMLLT